MRQLVKIFTNMETKYFQIWVKTILAVSGNEQEESKVLVITAENFGEAYATALTYNKEIILISEITKDTYDVMRTEPAPQAEDITGGQMPDGELPNVEP